MRYFFGLYVKYGSLCLRIIAAGYIFMVMEWLLYNPSMEQGIRKLLLISTLFAFG